MTAKSASALENGKPYQGLSGMHFKMKRNYVNISEKLFFK